MLEAGPNVDALVARVRTEGTPVIDGDTAVFVAEGPVPPMVVGDFNGWGGHNTLEMEEIAPQIWAERLQLPPDAYIEYALVYGDDRVLDPLNARVIGNGLGGFNNYFTMPLAPAVVPKVPRGTPRGKILRRTVLSDLFVVGGKRTVYLYVPPVQQPVPLLVVLDGENYLRLGHLNRVVDNLIAQRLIQPFAMAFVSHGRQARIVEYDCSEATIAFLLNSVLPLAAQEINLLNPEEMPGAHGILGASVGGLQSLYTGLRVPHVFGKVLSQSGSFMFNLAGVPSVIYDLIRYDPVRPIQIFMEVGRFEILLDVDRRMFGLLQERGYSVQFQEFDGGHNYAAWSMYITPALQTLFPPL